MEYIWNIYGIYMEYIWNIYGIYMEYIWNIYMDIPSGNLLQFANLNMAQSN